MDTANRENSPADTMNRYDICAKIRERAYNIYVNPNCDIGDVGEYLDGLVVAGRISSREALYIMESVYEEVPM